MKIFSFLLILFFSLSAQAQNFEREFPIDENASIKIVNLHGRVSIVAEESKTNEETEETENTETGKAFLNAQNANETDLKIKAETKRLEIVVAPGNEKSRIDLILKIPADLKLNIETADGEVRLEGRIESAEIKTETGTIAANVPLDDLKYNFVWTESRPRFLSDVTLEEVKEKSAGKFIINGKIGEEKKDKKEKVKKEDETGKSNEEEESEIIKEEETNKKAKSKKPKTKNQKL